MAIDTTPSTVATNALQALPFSSLIGGPLDACIKAQANSAMTSWQFINEVGLYVDPETGEKKAVQVVFSYNSNGQMTTLVVPLLTIVPIPYLAIDAVTIDFIANISAASSSVQEDSSNEDLNVNATAEASVGVGPFSLKINASANYSSKHASKSSKESKYSVEYTMNVSVKGGQADMPPGLGTILNILQSSATSNNTGDMIVAIPEKVYFNLNQSPTTSSQVQITVKDSHGVVAPGVDVTATIQASIGDDPFSADEANRREIPIRKVALLGSVNPDFNPTHPYRVKQKLERSRFLTRAEFKAHKDYEAKGIYSKMKSGVGLMELTTGALGEINCKTNDKGQANFTFNLNPALDHGSYSGRIEFDATIPAPEGSSAPEQQYTTSINYIVIKPRPNRGSTTLSADPHNLVFSGDADEELTTTISATGYPEGEGKRVDFELSSDIRSSFTTTPDSSIDLTENNGKLTGTLKLKKVGAPSGQKTGKVTIKDPDNNTTWTTVNVSISA